MMNRNVLLVVIGLLGAAGGIFGYWLYQDRQTTGIEVNIGRSGITIQER